MTFKAAILTVSDRGSSGERDDASGPALAQWLEDKGITIVATEVVPDEKKIISSRLMEWSDKGFCELILTTGGTGVSPRDVTPDATSEILDKTIPGFGEIMRRKGTEKTPMAIISRATAGVRKQSLIVNLPGSPKAALENIESIWDAVPHTIEKMLGDTRDCGSDH